jgi:3-hydroxyisobutyrate dehydrogenase-like beta-hydroxyacid dehydrogenase
MADVIAVIAPGEMGSAVGRRLREHGARVITSLNGRGAASAARAERDGMVPVASDGDLVGQADFILSIVPPGQAVGLAERLRDPLRRAARKPVFIDFNAVAPDTAKQIGAIVTETGCRFLDGGIIGGPPKANYSGPTFYVSGEGGSEALRLSAHGLALRVIDGPVGAASALKMSYAGITKGFTAIGTVMMLGAARAGCADALRQELAESQPQLLAWLDGQVPGMFPKAYRWVAEMEEIAGFLADDPAGRGIYEGAARLYERLAEAAEAPAPDGEIDRLAAFCGAGAKLRKSA